MCHCSSTSQPILAEHDCASRSAQSTAAWGQRGKLHDHGAGGRVLIYLWSETKPKGHSRFRADSMSVRTSGSACEQSARASAPTHAVQASKNANTQKSGSGVTSAVGICTDRVLKNSKCTFEITHPPPNVGPAATTRPGAVVRLPNKVAKSSVVEPVLIWQLVHVCVVILY